MTHLSVCTGCASQALACPTRDKLRAAVRGLGVTSIRHRCHERIPLYAPGAPVLVKTSAWLSRDDAESVDVPPKTWFPGFFIRQKGNSAIAFIRPGTMEAYDDSGHTFETIGEGFVKVPFARVMPRGDDKPIPVDECRLCGRIVALVSECNLAPADCPCGKATP